MLIPFITPFGPFWVAKSTVHVFEHEAVYHYVHNAYHYVLIEIPHPIRHTLQDAQWQLVRGYMATYSRQGHCEEVRDEGITTTSRPPLYP